MRAKLKECFPSTELFGLKKPSSMCLLGRNNILPSQAFQLPGHPLWWSLESRPWNYTTNLKRIFFEVLGCFWLVTGLLLFFLCLLIFIDLWHFLTQREWGGPWVGWGGQTSNLVVSHLTVCQVWSHAVPEPPTGLLGFYSYLRFLFYNIARI